jgi:hypothetical protein
LLIDIIILVSFYVLIVSMNMHFGMDFLNNPPIFKAWFRIT